MRSHNKMVLKPNVGNLLMRILLVASDPAEYAVVRISNAIRASGIECAILQPRELTFNVSGYIQPVESWLGRFSFIVFRNLAGPEWGFVRTIRYAMLAASQQLTKRVLNGESYYKFPVLSKLAQTVLLRSAGLQAPRSIYMAGQDEFPFGFPCIVKANFGSRGNDVHLVKEQSDWHRLCGTYGIGNVIMQEYLPGTHDYRVLVIGREAVGLHKRVAPSGDFRTNYTVGGQLVEVEPELADEIKEMAIASAQVFRCDFCGVDLRYSAEGELNVLEINRSAGFEGMEEVMGIPAGQYFSEYIIKMASRPQ